MKKIFSVALFLIENTHVSIRDPISYLPPLFHTNKKLITTIIKERVNSGEVNLAEKLNEAMIEKIMERVTEMMDKKLNEMQEKLTNQNEKLDRKLTDFQGEMRKKKERGQNKA